MCGELLVEIVEAHAVSQGGIENKKVTVLTTKTNWLIM
jgi:hypothetical protein